MPDLKRPRPNPEPDEERKEPRRYWFCAHYNGCLDKAIKGNWDSFSCINCLAFKEELPTYTEAVSSYGKEDPAEEWNEWCL